MQQEEIKNIRIYYPNTVSEYDQRKFAADNNCVIKKGYKDAEMVKVGWFFIYKDEKLIAEIKESICDIYYD